MGSETSALWVKPILWLSLGSPDRPDLHRASAHLSSPSSGQDKVLQVTPQPGSSRPVLKGSAQSHRPVESLGIFRRHTSVCWEGTSLEQPAQEELWVPAAQPASLKGPRRLRRERARCWGMLRPRAVRWRRQPWKQRWFLTPRCPPHPWVCALAGHLLVAVKPSAIFPRAWGWHRLLIFLDAW